MNEAFQLAGAFLAGILTGCLVMLQLCKRAVIILAKSGKICTVAQVKEIVEEIWPK